MTRFFIPFIVVFFSHCAYAQKIKVDTIHGVVDSIRITRNGKVITPEYYAKRYQPRKALLYSAVLPGMGQIYNRKYWKLPIVYGGFAGLGWVTFTYGSLYDDTKQDLFKTIQDPTYQNKNGYSEEQLRSAAEFYRRQRDFFMILTGFWYLLQLVDAHVDAHLREFDLNPQLRVSVEPSMQRSNLYGSVSGVSLTVKF